MNKEQTEVDIKINSQKELIESVEQEIKATNSKLNSLNDHKAQLKSDLFEINDSKEEDPEEVKRRMLEEMSKGQSDKKITHQEIQTRHGHISDVNMNINFEEKRRDDLLDQIKRLKENYENRKF